jgi:Holliday junction DNA helicase RuvA
VIERVRGKLLEKTAGKLVVEVGGLGLMLRTSMSTYLALPEPPSEASLFVRMVIREESWELFAFLTRLEREGFDILTSVSRVGPRLALTVLSALEPMELGRAILSQDLTRLSAIKGIGQKTAERLLVELKDKASRLVSLAEENQASGGEGGPSAGDFSRFSDREEASLALQSLGYTKAESEKALKSIAPPPGQSPDLGFLIREALKRLSS